jgi:multidrug resistance efflux pump
MAMGLLTACGGEEAANERSVALYTVQRTDLRITVREHGEIQAARTTRVVSPIKGRAGLIYLIPEGTMVERGDKLAELDVSGIADQRATQAVVVAKAQAAFAQAEKRFEVLETGLSANRTVAEGRVTMSRLRWEKFIGRPSRAAEPPGQGPIPGSNGEMLARLEELVSSELLGSPGAEVSDSTLLDGAMEVLGEDDVNLEMGEMAIRVLKQVEEVILARTRLVVAKNTLADSQRLYQQGFIEQRDLDRDLLAHESRRSRLSLSWNALELLLRYTLRETKILLAQDVQSAQLNLDTVLASNDGSRLSERAGLASKAAELELAMARLDNLDQQIQGAIITAPTPGMVVYARERNRDNRAVGEGMDVHERQTLINLPDLTRVVAELRVGEPQVDLVSVGQEATVVVDAYPGQTYLARVSRVAGLPDAGFRDAAAGSMVYTVVVALDGENGDGALRPGMNATVEILIREIRDATCVPLPAVHRDGDIAYVWKVTAGGPVATRVMLGANNLGLVEILDGLFEGEQVHLGRPPGAKAPDLSGRRP